MPVWLQDRSGFPLGSALAPGPLVKQSGQDPARKSQGGGRPSAGATSIEPQGRDVPYEQPSTLLGSWACGGSQTADGKHHGYRKLNY